MSLRRKILLILAIPLLGQVVVLIALLLVEKQQADLQRWHTHSAEVLIAVGEARRLILSSETYARGYIIAPRTELLADAASLRGEALRKLDEVLNLVADNPGQTARAQRVRSLATRLLDAQQANLLAAREARSDDLALGVVAAHETLGAYRVAITDFMDEEQRLLEERGAAAARANELWTAGIFFGSLAEIGLIVVAIHLLHRSLSRRLGVLVDNAMRLEDWQPLNAPLAGRDEFARLDGVFHRMAEKLSGQMARQQMEAEAVAHAARHDPLTGLPNRKMFSERLASAVALAEVRGGTFGLLFLDLDGFKPINDTHGHETGDAVLKAVAGRIVGSVRATDLVARLGGDEFVVVLNSDVTEAQAEAAGRQILASIGGPVVLGSVTVRVSASVGVAIYPMHGKSPSDLLRAADEGMYAGKRAGKATVRIGRAA